jgi:crotonobetainyl-CoA:carnitine CoA-transferase CaiB-like acyl-CoA transferase
MTAVMEGVRILEVAEHTFVPAASALLADLGAEVVKIEHVERGDAMRGLASSGTIPIGGDVHVLLEHSNRGKQSLGLYLTSPEGRDLLYRLAESCDVFLTNKMPSVRTKLKIDLEDIRAHNSSIIYVRGHGQGERGPDADRGSYDSLAYWCRAGIAASLQQIGSPPPGPPGPAFGDSIGAMTIAGAIMGALFHRERTGHAPEVDVSLLSTGLWSNAAGIALSLQLQFAFGPRPGDYVTGNPLVSNYQTKDERWVSLCCLQPGKYWAEACTVIGVPELVDDERFKDADSILANAASGIELLRQAFALRTLDEWRERLNTFSGQWTIVQNTLEVADDLQTVSNGYVLDCETADGTPFKLVSAPMQFDRVPAQPRRAPEFNEHGDEILSGLGLEMDTIMDLKIRGVVA